MMMTLTPRPHLAGGVCEGSRGLGGTVRGGGIKNVLFVVVVGDGVVVATVVPLTLGAISRDLSMGCMARVGSVPPAYSRSSGVAVFLRACRQHSE